MAMVRISEGVGVAFNLAYTWLYLNGTLPLGYAFAGMGAVAMGWACWKRNLQAETALHGFYLVMAGVGAWLVWCGLPLLVVGGLRLGCEPAARAHEQRGRHP